MNRHHHHHHVMPPARISLTLSRHTSLSFIASGRSSGLHPVSSPSCYMKVRAGHPAFARPCEGVHIYIYIYIYIYNADSHIYMYMCVYTYIYIYMLWSRGGWIDSTTRKWVVKNILKENSTYIKDNWEKPLLSLTHFWISHLFLVTAHRDCTNEGESICRGDTTTICDRHISKVGNSVLLLILFTNTSARAGYDTGSTFKRSLTGLNSEFSFS